MMKDSLCGVCNHIVPIEHTQMLRAEKDGTHTSYHMRCESIAAKLEPCEDCGHHKLFCTECGESEGME
jgi:hypothetical protein